jgi:hypothetical protein
MRYCPTCNPVSQLLQGVDLGAPYHGADAAAKAVLDRMQRSVAQLATAVRALDERVMPATLGTFDTDGYRFAEAAPAGDGSWAEATGGRSSEVRIADPADQFGDWDGVSGVSAETATAGSVFGEVTDEGAGDWKLTLYSDAARTTAVASTTYNTTGSKTLTPETPGLSGTVTVKRLGPAGRNGRVQTQFRRARANDGYCGDALVGRTVLLQQWQDAAGGIQAAFDRPGIGCECEEVTAESGAMVSDPDGAFDISGVTGISRDNSDSGTIYLEVVDLGGGNYRADLYRDPARTILVGTTPTFTTTGDYALDGGGSGIGGTLTIANIPAAYPYDATAGWTLRTSSCPASTYAIAGYHAAYFEVDAGWTTPLLPEWDGILTETAAGSCIYEAPAGKQVNGKLLVRARLSKGGAGWVLVVVAQDAYLAEQTVYSGQYGGLTPQGRYGGTAGYGGNTSKQVVVR